MVSARRSAGLFSAAGLVLHHPPWRHSTARFAAMEPRLGALDCANARLSESSRTSSLLLANVRVIFVPHGRIGTACSKQWHTDRPGCRGNDRRRHTQSTARPVPNPTTVPHRWALGKRPCWCSLRAAQHRLFQTVAHRFGFRPAEQGHPRVTNRIHNRISKAE